MEKTLAMMRPYNPRSERLPEELLQVDKDTSRAAAFLLRTRSYNIWQMRLFHQMQVLPRR